jgi:hypothetical protein
MGAKKTLKAKDIESLENTTVAALFAADAKAVVITANPTLGCASLLCAATLGCPSLNCITIYCCGPYTCCLTATF